MIAGFVILICYYGVHTSKTYTYDKPLISPSGKYQIEILNGYNGVVHYKRFNIASLENRNEPEIIYCSTDTFRNRDRTVFT